MDTAKKKEFEFAATYAQMEIGQSFLVRGRVPHQMAALNHYHSKRLGRKFTSRRVDGGVIVTRTL